jgi:hypothetical protein
MSHHFATARTALRLFYDQDVITRTERCHAVADTIHHADAVVTKDAARLAGRNVALEDVRSVPQMGSFS